MAEELKWITDEELIGDYKMMMANADINFCGTTFGEMAEKVVKVEIIARGLEDRI